MALTYSQGYKRLLSGQSIKSINSSCPLRDPGGVCCVLRESTKREKCAVKSPILCEWWMWETKQELHLLCVEAISCYLIYPTEQEHARCVLRQWKKKIVIYQNSKLFPPKALGTFWRQRNINIVTATVKPGQGHHKYHVTFTVHIPLDSYE